MSGTSSLTSGVLVDWVKEMQRVKGPEDEEDGQLVTSSASLDIGQFTLSILRSSLFTRCIFHLITFVSFGIFAFDFLPSFSTFPVDLFNCFSPSIYISICLFTYLPIYIKLYVYLSIDISTYLCKAICISVYLPIYLSM